MLSFLKTNAPANRTRRPGLAVQQFGERIVPAGLVDVTFLNGTLKIVGDDAINTLTVTQTANGPLTLTTDIGTGLKVNGQAVVGFMGHTLATPVTGNVTINMGGGSDFLYFSGAAADLDLPGALTVIGGEGNNTVTFQQGVTVNGDTTINGGTGLDTVHLYDETNFLGKLTVNNGKGGSLLDGSATTDFQVGGVFAVNSGAGKDEINFATAHFVTLGGLVLKTGADADGSKTNFDPVEALTVNGNVAVTGGAGDDDFDLGDGTKVTKVTGKVTVGMGAGANHFDLVGTEVLAVGGPIRVTGGAGIDYAHLGIGSGLVSLGAVTVNAGAGFNGAIIGGEQLTVTGNVTYVGGAGTDDFDIGTQADGYVAGAVTAALGAGSNSFDAYADATHTLTFGKTLTVKNTSAANGNVVTLHGLKVVGATSVTTGAGNDFVTIDDVTFNGAFTLNTGAGNDKVNVEQSGGYAGHTVFNKAATFTTGADNDEVKVAGLLAEAERKAVFNGAAMFDGGPGADTLGLSDFGANIFYGAPAVKVGF